MLWMLLTQSFGSPPFQILYQCREQPHPHLTSPAGSSDPRTDYEKGMRDKGMAILVQFWTFLKGHPSSWTPCRVMRTMSGSGWLFNFSLCPMLFLSLAPLGTISREFHNAHEICRPAPHKGSLVMGRQLKCQHTPSLLCKGVKSMSACPQLVYRERKWGPGVHWVWQLRTSAMKLTHEC